MAGWVQENGGCGRLPGRQVLNVFEVAHESSGAGSILDGPDAPPYGAGPLGSGGTPSNDEGSSPANPAAARFYVDLLVVLKDKTEGARTDAETRQLDEVLYELRMRVMNLKPAADLPAVAKP